MRNCENHMQRTATAHVHKSRRRRIPHLPYLPLPCAHPRRALRPSCCPSSALGEVLGLGTNQSALMPDRAVIPPRPPPTRTGGSMGVVAARSSARRPTGSAASGGGATRCGTGASGGVSGEGGAARIASARQLPSAGRRRRVHGRRQRYTSTILCLLFKGNTRTKTTAMCNARATSWRRRATADERTAFKPGVNTTPVNDVAYDLLPNSNASILSL